MKYSIKSLLLHSRENSSDTNLYRDDWKCYSIKISVQKALTHGESLLRNVAKRLCLQPAHIQKSICFAFSCLPHTSSLLDIGTLLLYLFFFFPFYSSSCSSFLSKMDTVPKFQIPPECIIRVLSSYRLCGVVLCMFRLRSHPMLGRLYDRGAHVRKKDQYLMSLRWGTRTWVSQNSTRRLKYHWKMKSL